MASAASAGAADSPAASVACQAEVDMALEVGKADQEAFPASPEAFPVAFPGEAFPAAASQAEDTDIRVGLQNLDLVGTVVLALHAWEAEVKASAVAASSAPSVVRILALEPQGPHRILQLAC